MFDERLNVLFQSALERRNDDQVVHVVVIHRVEPDEDGSVIRRGQSNVRVVRIENVPHQFLFAGHKALDYRFNLLAQCALLHGSSLPAPTPVFDTVFFWNEPPPKRCITPRPPFFQAGLENRRAGLHGISGAAPETLRKRVPSRQYQNETPGTFTGLCPATRSPSPPIPCRSVGVVAELAGQEHVLPVILPVTHLILRRQRVRYFEN